MAARSIIDPTVIPPQLEGVTGGVARASKLSSILGQKLLPVEAEAVIGPDIQTLERLGFITVTQQAGQKFYQATHQ